MSPRKKTRVKSAVRVDRMKAKWNDPTKDADGLTYRERMAKRAKEQREREKLAPPPSSKATPPTPPAAPPKPPAALPTPEKKTVNARTFTPGRAYR